MSAKKNSDKTEAGIKEEMAKPRMAKSARMAELHLDRERTPEPPSASMLGTVDRILLSTRPSQSEKAQIGIHGAGKGHRSIRIENVLTNEHGDDVKLRKGARVQVTVTANPKS
jgi:hypothetical protein